jgi:RNA polymerase sigma-70 factor (ECF subfamily)
MGSGSGHQAPAAPAVNSDSFATTRWTLVLTAGGDGSTRSRHAMAELCALYWYPLYAFIRRKGHDPDAAQDLTQGFFARLLERDIVRTADRDRGRFRSYLLGAVQHFLSDERDRQHALKRGGGQLTISRDLETAEQRYALEPSHDETPERLFERRWASTVLQLVLAELRAQFQAEGKLEQFERLKPYLTQGPSDGTQAQAAAELGMTPGAARVALHRMRTRYARLLREQIAQTVASPADVEEEIRHLRAAVRR